MVPLSSIYDPNGLLYASDCPLLVLIFDINDTPNSILELLYAKIPEIVFIGKTPITFDRFGEPVIGLKESRTHTFVPRVYYW